MALLEQLGKLEEADDWYIKVIRNEEEDLK